MKNAYAWLRARLCERSTLVGISMACGAAAALPWPWSAISFGVGTIAALIPDNKP